MSGAALCFFPAFRQSDVQFIISPEKHQACSPVCEGNLRQVNAVVQQFQK
jgi:hypothetical protein